MFLLQLPSCVLFHLFDEFLEWNDVGALDMAICNTQLRNHFLMTLASGGTFHRSFFVLSDYSVVYLQNRQIKVHHLAISTRYCSISTFEALLGMTDSFLCNITAISTKIVDNAECQNDWVQYNVLLAARWVMKIITACTNLRRLDYQDVQYDYSTAQVNYLSGEFTRLLFAKNHCLKTLEITKTIYFDDSCISSLLAKNSIFDDLFTKGCEKFPNLQAVKMINCQQLTFSTLCKWLKCITALEDISIEAIDPMFICEDDTDSDEVNSPATPPSSPQTESIKTMAVEDGNGTQRRRKLHKGIQKIAFYGPGITFSMIYYFFCHVLPSPSQHSLLVDHSSKPSLQYLFIEYADLLQKLYTFHVDHPSARTHSRWYATATDRVPSLFQLLYLYYPTGNYHFYVPVQEISLRTAVKFDNFVLDTATADSRSDDENEVIQVEDDQKKKKQKQSSTGAIRKHNSGFASSKDHLDKWLQNGLQSSIRKTSSKLSFRMNV